jgi:acylphosphatase
MAVKRVQAKVTGRVQGVGFRASCQRQALAAGVTGWVRNLWDGGVEACFEGPADRVDTMIAWCRQGPPAADVESVTVTPLPDGEPFRSFAVKS